MKSTRGTSVALALVSIGVVTLGLTGCNPTNNVVSATTESQESVDTQPVRPPLERFVDEYIDGELPEGDCLATTAYDVTVGDMGSSSITPPSALYVESTGTLVITPVSGMTQLTLRGFDEDDKPLWPVDSRSEAILYAYGCDIEP